MTDKIILELTLDELKTLDKHIEYNEETKSVFDKIKYAYPQPKMTLQQEGDYVVVSYNNTTYYRLMGEDATCFCWYIKKGVSVTHPVPTLVMITDAETERLLEGLYYNHIVVKKEKEMIRQNLKTSLEELANGDVRPIDDVIEEAKEEQTKTPCEIAYKDWWGEYPSNTWQCDVARWEAFKMGYNAAYQKPKDNEWKNVALEFGKKLPVILPYSYAELSPNAWYKWAIFVFDGYVKQRDIECGYTRKYQEPEEPVSFVPKEIKELIKEGLEWCEDHPNENPLDYLTPKTPEETEKSLREAFVEAQKTEKWKEIQKLIDEEDNDKNFKNSLDLIKEWGEKNKPKTLYEICMEWWDEVFVNQMDDDICVDVLVSKIDKEFIPPSSEKNGYEWEKCLKIMREKLR